MKQIALFIFISLMAMNTLSAQGKWSWGMKIQMGVNGQKEERNNPYESTTTIREFTYKTQRKPSIGGGLWGQYQLGENLALRSGIQYSNVGASTSDISSTRVKTTSQLQSYSENTYSMRIHRIQVPLMLEYQFNKGGFQPFIGAGIVWNNDRSGQIDEKYYNHNFEQFMDHQPADAPVNLKKKEMQLAFSLGVNLTDRISIELNHLIGRENWHMTWSPEASYSIGLPILIDVPISDIPPTESVIMPAIPVCIYYASTEFKAAYQQQTNLEIQYSF